jgi:hypothetical protein
MFVITNKLQLFVMCSHPNLKHLLLPPLHQMRLKQFLPAVPARFCSAKLS